MGEPYHLEASIGQNACLRSPQQQEIEELTRWACRDPSSVSSCVLQLQSRKINPRSQRKRKHVLKAMIADESNQAFQAASRKQAGMHMHRSVRRGMLETEVRMQCQSEAHWHTLHMACMAIHTKSAAENFRVKYAQLSLNASTARSRQLVKHSNGLQLHHR
jgi:hypothetical protein